MKALTYSHLIYASLGFIGLMLIFGLAQARRRRRRTGQSREPVSIAYVLQEIETLRADLTAARQRSEAQDRRLKWLESRISASPVATASAADDDELIIDGAAQPRSIVERRYQVLKLARLGLDIEAIADRLNLPHGEVGLILGLRNLRHQFPVPSSKFKAAS